MWYNHGVERDATRGIGPRGASRAGLRAGARAGADGQGGGGNAHGGQQGAAGGAVGAQGAVARAAGSEARGARGEGGSYDALERQHDEMRTEAEARAKEARRLAGELEVEKEAHMQRHSGGPYATAAERGQLEAILLEARQMQQYAEAQQGEAAVLAVRARKAHVERMMALLELARMTDRVERRVDEARAQLRGQLLFLSQLVRGVDTIAPRILLFLPSSWLDEQAGVVLGRGRG